MTYDPSELTRPARVVYVAVIRAVANVDNLISLPEMTRIRRLVADLGEEEWSELVTEGVREFGNWQNVVAAFSELDYDARATILEDATELAASDGIDDAEQNMLDDLSFEHERRSHYYFRLCFVVMPGGSRKTEYWVLGSLDEVKRAAQRDLASGDGAYHALLYGEEILLEVWQNGKQLDAIDLHPFITYSVEGVGENLRFEGEGDEPMFSDFPDWTDDLVQGMLVIDVDIDWDEVPIPELRGQPLPDWGRGVFEGGQRWEYGHHNEWDAYLPRHTGDTEVVQDEAKRASGGPLRRRRRARPGELSCSGCEELQHDVRWIVTGEKLNVCRECALTLIDIAKEAKKPTPKQASTSKERPDCGMCGQSDPAVIHVSLPGGYVCGHCIDNLQKIKEEQG